MLAARRHHEVRAGEPLSYAAGTYVIPAGQPFAGQRPATGAQAAPGFQPSDASSSARNNYAAYVELGYNPTQKLFLGAAARYENYDDDSGDTLVGKINGRYEFTDWLSVRAAASTGFRAPGLAQQNYAASSSQFRLVNGVLDLLLIKTLPVGSPEARALGAKPLQPEESKNYSLGVTLTPAPNLAVTIDAYQIDVDGRIAITSTLTGANIPPFGMCTSLANPTVAAATSAALGVLTPMPCLPAVVAPWVPGAPRTLIGGKPALTSGSTCTCAYGGVISLTFPGAVRTMAE